MGDRYLQTDSGGHAQLSPFGRNMGFFFSATFAKRKVGNKESGLDMLGPKIKLR